MDEPDRKIWGDTLAHLRTSAPDLCRNWFFTELMPVSIDGGVMTVRATSPVQRTYLAQHAVAAFNEAAQVASSSLLSVRFIGPDDPLEGPTGPNPGRHPARPPAHTHPDDTPLEPAPIVEPKPMAVHRATEAITPDHRDALNINPDHNFDNFIEGPANRLASAASRAVANNPGDSYNPLFLHSGVGLGKTHLLQAICLRILEHTPNASIYFLSCEAFVSQFIEAVRGGEMSEFRHRFRDIDVLVIDDIHFLTGRDRTQEEFFHTFNALYQSSKQIVLSSDAPPEDIPDLEDRLVSRFKWGLVTKLETPDFETRAAIVQTKGRLRGLDIPSEVAEFVASRFDQNVRELEGAIRQLQILASVDHRAIDLALAREALGDVPEIDAVAHPSLNEITAAVTGFYDVKVTDLQSRRRHKSISLPRQVCMFLARQHTPLSLEEIGGFYGGRDHTTVMHAVKTIGDRAEQDAQIHAALRQIRHKLGL